MHSTLVAWISRNEVARYLKSLGEKKKINDLDHDNEARPIFAALAILRRLGLEGAFSGSNAIAGWMLDGDDEDAHA